MDGPTLAVGKPRGERADAARNRILLLDTARELMAEQGADKVTMDGLAARAGLGKGTVFRRFGSRAGIFQALLDDEERALQQEILSGKPPLGPGAPPLERLVAYGRARVEFLFEHREIARASLDGGQPIPAGNELPVSRLHIRMLLGLLKPAVADLDVLAVQLAAALDGPLLLMLPVTGADVTRTRDQLARGWTELVERVCG
ncbi:TetR/AcrR family transcriptional regulator [Amycolatopsis sp. 195334CR]|uniref:TetR/AcrR family transcriptional regulator n=1 Tax=Amycolatopsis sp. 195334CR TaxID=2814588 RepID=UPI001A8CD65A|nr:TetR/AcrR family transcriptional regulator [Amycolatopsis sp. 195334CR]MBN6040931.1 TetR/AcrR family transcriptional regulator [Amycolatopsis sp. 195334CR]